MTMHDRCLESPSCSTTLQNVELGVGLTLHPRIAHSLCLNYCQEGRIEGVRTSSCLYLDTGDLGIDDHQDMKASSDSLGFTEGVTVCLDLTRQTTAPIFPEGFPVKVELILREVLFR